MSQELNLKINGRQIEHSQILTPDKSVSEGGTPAEKLLHIIELVT